jgi:hypothetical protein
MCAPLAISANSESGHMDFSRKLKGARRVASVGAPFYLPPVGRTVGRPLS